MIPDRYWSEPRRECADAYRSIEDECRKNGVLSAHAQHSLERDSRSGGALRLLRVHAFKPTGVAAGCPLPGKKLGENLWQLCIDFNEWLQSLAESSEPQFAAVPPEFLHITMVNRDHFDMREEGLGVTKLSIPEWEMASKIVRNFRDQVADELAIGCDGLILSQQGRLLLQCSPMDQRFFDLKQKLYDGVPSLRTNFPMTTHVKLGHILMPLDACQVDHAYDWLRSRDAIVRLIMLFHSLYTPRGRLYLREGLM